jgi:hypothetical protein
VGTETTTITRQERKHKLVLYKGGKCQDCGHSFPDVCYDFDHRDPNEKLFAISNPIGHSYEEILMEPTKKS